MSQATVEIGAIQRGAALVVDPLRLTFPTDSVVGVVGPNGAGKTSLMMAIAGLLRSKPSVTFQAIEAPPVGYMSQTPQLAGWLTGREILHLYGATVQTLPAPVQAAIKPLLGRRVSTLSGGQRAFLAVVATLALRLPLTLLDEPFASLDMIHRRLALNTLADSSWSLRSRALLISSQAPADLYEVCTHFVVLREGRVVFHGDAASMADGRSRLSLPEFERKVLGMFTASTGSRTGHSS